VREPNERLRATFIGDAMLLSNESARPHIAAATAINAGIAPSGRRKTTLPQMRGPLSPAPAMGATIKKRML